MLNVDLSGIDDILTYLDAHGYPFAQYCFCKENGLFRIVGEGGSSVVYDMVDRQNSKKHYAMKVIGLKQQTVSSADFWDTIRIQKILNEDSPYIMRVLMARELYVRVDETGRVTEVLEAEDIKDKKTGSGFLLQFVLMEKLEELVRKDKYKKVTLVRTELGEEKEVLKFAAEIGQALACAHENGVLHRDIKLENIFWDAEASTYKLGDFGIAKYVGDGNAETVVYTDGYGAPEIERRLQKNYNATADIYSFGITLYLLLNNLKFPGSAGYYANLIQYNPEFEFPAPENASEMMACVIRKMCRYRSEERYQSMTEVLTAFDQVRDSKEERDEDEAIEYADLRTETFREENDEEESAEDIPLDRATRHIYEKYAEEIYKKISFGYLMGFAVLFALLFGMWQEKMLSVQQWEFWILPIVLLLESVLLRIKEFHFGFGLASVSILVYSMTVIGVSVPHVSMLLCICTGIPSLTAGCALGTGLWMLTCFSNQFAGLMSYIKIDIGWILFALILILLSRFILIRNMFVPGGRVYTDICVFAIDKLPFALMLAGIIVQCMKKTAGLKIPEEVVRMHLFWTGLIWLAANIILYVSNDGEVDDEQLDEDRDRENHDSTG